MTLEKIFKPIFLTIIAIGILMSIVNLSSNRSFWVDEAMLAQNIVSLPYSELIEPLKYYSQMAPVGFLMVEKICSELFKPIDIALRIFPFICSMISLYFLDKLMLTLQLSKSSRLFGLAYFSIAYYNIYYAAEVKQYMTELTGGLILTFLYTKYRENQLSYPVFIMGVSGVLCILFSNIAIILLFVIGSLMLLDLYFKENKLKKETITILTCWTFSFLMYYYKFYFRHPSNGYMMNYWTNVGGFIPYDFLTPGFYKSIYKKFVILISLTGQGHKLIPLMALGGLYLWKKSKIYLILLIAPLIVHFGLAYFKLYPIFPRLILYLLPMLIVLTSLGFQFLMEKFPNYSSIAYLLMSILLLYNLYAYTKWGFPIQRQEIKKVMAHLNERINEDDEILVYHSSKPAYLFYKDQFGNLNNKNAKEVFIENHKNNWNLYLNYTKELDDNLWLLVSETNWVLNEDQKSELDIIVDQIINKGYCEKEHFNSFGVDLYRYELQ